MGLADNLIQAMITLGAVVLGFTLGQFAEWLKSSNSEKKKAKSLQALIDLEVAKNISQVSAYWDKVLTSNDDLLDEDGDFKSVSLANFVATNPFPVLSLIAWRANLGEIASVYTVKEMEKLWGLQDNLEHLSLLHSFFIEANNEKMNVSNAQENNVIGLLRSGFHFSILVGDHALEFKERVESILSYKKQE